MSIWEDIAIKLKASRNRHQYPSQITRKIDNFKINDNIGCNLSGLQLTPSYYALSTLLHGVLELMLMD